jgi:hypothetical protein
MALKVSVYVCERQNLKVCIYVQNGDFFLAVLGLELRVYTLSHSASPFCVRYF